MSDVNEGLALARTVLRHFADTLVSQATERKVSVRAVGRSCGIDSVRMHHIANARAVPTEDEAQRLIAWMMNGTT